MSVPLAPKPGISGIFGQMESALHCVFYSRVNKLFPVLHLLIKCPVTKLQTNRNVDLVLLLYVNSIEKWTGMKNTGLKMPKKDQIYV